MKIQTMARALAITAVSTMGAYTASASTLFDFAPGATGYPFNPVGNVNTGQPSFNQTVSGTTLTAVAAGGLGTISANNQTAGTGIIGIGVAGGGGTAINAVNTITVSFDTDMLLEQIILDGHANPDSAGVTLPGTGLFSVIGANTVNGTPPPGVTFLSTNGADQTVDDTITFGTPFALSAGQTLVFSNVTSGGYFVRSITGTIVPEPASLALLGLGGLAIATRRRSRNN